MNFKEALLKVGTGILRESVPGAGLIISTLNQLLPKDKRLPDSATGQQVDAALNELPPDVRAQIHSQDIELKIAESNNWRAIQEAHATADASGATTRPYIAKLMAWYFVLASFPVSLAIAAALFNKNPDLMDMAGDAWPLLAVLLATPIWLLRAYFGDRTKEKTARYAASVGQEVNKGLFSKLFGNKNG